MGVGVEGRVCVCVGGGGGSCVCQNCNSRCSVSAANDPRVNISVWLPPLSHRLFSLKIGSSASFDGEYLSVFFFFFTRRAVHNGSKDHCLCFHPTPPVSTFPRIVVFLSVLLFILA